MKSGIAYLFFFLNCSIFCRAQHPNSFTDNELPFKVSFKKTIRVPDSLRNKNFQPGQVVLLIKVNQKGVKGGFNIVRLNITTIYGEDIRYVQGERMIQDVKYYPTSIRPYYPIFSAYVNSMVISKKEKFKGKTIPKENYFYVLVRLI